MHYSDLLYLEILSFTFCNTDFSFFSSYMYIVLLIYMSFIDVKMSFSVLFYFLVH